MRKTRNERMEKIFSFERNLALSMKKFLVENGIGQEEAERLYQGTGLGGSALQSKLIELGLKDKFYSKLGKDGLRR